MNVMFLTEHICALMTAVYVLAPYRNQDVVDDVNTATQQSQKTTHFVKATFTKENPVLIEMPVWNQQPWADVVKVKVSHVM